MAATAVLGVGLAFLVERTDLPGRRVWHGLLVAPLAVPAFVNGYAWVSLDRSVARLRRRLRRRHAVLLPARLPPGRRDAASPRPGARGVRLVARPLPHPHLPHGRAAPAAPRPPRRRPAGRPAPARRVRRAVAAALPDLHDRDLRPVRLDLQRRRRDRDGRRAGPAAASSCCSPTCGCAATGGTPASAAVPRAASYPVPLGPWRLPVLATVGAVVGLAVGVPAFSLVRWLVVGTSTQFPVAELTEALVATVVLALAGAVVTTLAAIPVVWLAVRHRGRALDPHRAQHLRRQRTARHRGRPGARRGVAAARAGRLPDRDPPRGGVRHPLPAAGRGDRACRAGAGAGGARRRRTQPRRRAARDRPPGHPAADRAQPRRRRRAGLPRDLDRADRDPACSPRSAPARWPPSSGRRRPSCATARRRPTPCCWCSSPSPRPCC